MERDQAREQCAYRSHRCHDNPRMRSAIGQIRLVQRHKMANVVCDDHTPMGCGVLEDSCIRPALLMEFIDVVNIDASLS